MGSLYDEEFTIEGVGTQPNPKNCSKNAEQIEIQTKHESESNNELTKTNLIFLFVGLVLSIFLAALDRTIISTALTTITTELDALNEVTWVASSYLLTSTALQPLYGKFSDIFGRKATMLFSLFIFLVGSIVCGAATDVIMLIVFRAISGIGGGGLITLSVIIISDIVPLEKRGLYVVMVGANFAVASVVGPLIGGVFAQEVSWRWDFYINIPICIIAMVAIFFFLKLPSNNQGFKEKLKRIDYLGTTTLVLFITLFLLALNWGGKEYSWASPAVLSTLIISIVLLAVFIFIEVKIAKEPVIPPNILTRNVIISNLNAFFIFAIFYAAIFYLPIYYQVVYQHTAITAGLELLPLLVGVVICSMGTGVFMSKVGIYRPLIWSGSVLALIGTVLLGVLMRPDISRAELVIFSFMLGLGIGLCIQTNVIVSQAAVDPKDIAVVTSLVNFSQSIGGVMGIAICGTVFQNTLAAHLSTYLPVEANVAEITKSLNAGVTNIDSTLAHIVQNGYVEATKYLFLVGISFTIIPLISGIFLEHIPLKSPNIKPTDRDISSMH